MQIEEYQDKFLSHFKLFYSYSWCQRQTGGYSDGIFSNLYYGKLTQREGTLCVPNISRIHMAL